MNDSSNSDDSEDSKIPVDNEVGELSRNGSEMAIPGEPLPYTVRKKFERVHSQYYQDVDFDKYDSEDLTVIIDAGSDQHNRPNRINPLKEADYDSEFIKEELPELIQHAEDPDRMLFGRAVLPKRHLLKLENEDIVKIGMAMDNAGVDYFIAPPVIAEDYKVREEDIDDYIDALETLAEKTDNEMAIVPTIYLGSADDLSGRIFARKVNSLPKDRFELLAGHVQEGMPYVKSKDAISALKNLSDRKLAFVDVPQRMDQYRRPDDEFGDVSREKAYAMIGGSVILRKRWIRGGGSGKEKLSLLSENGEFEKVNPGDAESTVPDTIPLKKHQDHLESTPSTWTDVEGLHNDFAPQRVFEKFREDLRSSENEEEIWEGREQLEEAVSFYLD